MRNRELSRQLQSLTALFANVVRASASDIELQSHWAKYLCVLAAGYLENSITEIYSEYVTSRSSQEVANYANNRLAQIRNPKTGKFIETANAFNNTWGVEIENYAAQNGRKDAIDSIMNNRHLIVHGRNSGITIARLREWLDHSVEVLEFIENQIHRQTCNKSS